MVITAPDALACDLPTLISQLLPWLRNDDQPAPLAASSPRTYKVGRFVLTGFNLVVPRDCFATIRADRRTRLLLYARGARPKLLARFDSDVVISPKACPHVTPFDEGIFLLPHTHLFVESCSFTEA